MASVGYSNEWLSAAQIQDEVSMLSFDDFMAEIKSISQEIEQVDTLTKQYLNSKYQSADEWAERYRRWDNLDWSQLCQELWKEVVECVRISARINDRELFRRITNEFVEQVCVYLTQIRPNRSSFHGTDPCPADGGDPDLGFRWKRRLKAELIRHGWDEYQDYNRFHSFIDNLSQRLSV